MKERRDLFDEFCKEKIRQQRAAKQAAPKVDVRGKEKHFDCFFFITEMCVRGTFFSPLRRTDRY